MSHNIAMNKRVRILILWGMMGWPLSGLAASSPVASGGTIGNGTVVELGLQQTLRLAEQESPDLQAAQEREKEAMENSTIAESGFFPTLNLDAVASNGFPGSSSGLDGFDGLVASPYREGPAAGAYSQWNLVDISLWHNVSAAHDAYDASEQVTRFERSYVDQQALSVYLAGVCYRGDAQAWQQMVKELTGVQQAVKQFVRNGQYPEVAKILIDDQLENANLDATDYNTKYQTALVRLGLLTGMAPQSIACPLPESVSADELKNLLHGASPLILRAADEQKAASEMAKKYSAENLPKLEVAASAGYLSNTRLIDSQDTQDYSVFVGITMPIFEGFRMDAEEKKASDEEKAKVDELAAAKLTLADLNAQYDQQIATAQSDLAILVPEQDTVKRGVAMAKQRYLSFLGPLSDLQQALKDMVYVNTQVAEVKTNLLLALGSKAFLNGASLESTP